MDINKIQQLLEKELNKNRYEHTISVMYTAGAIAMSQNYNIQKAMLAGLLHDCAKCIPNKEKIILCKEYHIQLTPIEIENPTLIHAKLGAYLAEHIYEVKDKEILDAIEFHTTGRPNMTKLDKIIYIADSIEPGRKYKNLESVRYLAFHNIDRALFKILQGSTRYLERINAIIDPLTIETYEFYKKKQHK